MKNEVPEFAFGAPVRLKLDVDVDDVLVDPGAVTVTIKPPNAAVIGPVAAQRDSQGRYHHDLIGNAAGKWYYRFDGAGANDGADEQAFIIRKSHIV